MSADLDAKQDTQTVTPEGRPVKPLIDGVKMHKSTIHVDDRGTLCEIHNKLWEFLEEPVEHVYYVTIRQMMVKGWIYHKTYTDRLMVLRGTAKVVLYDYRAWERSMDESKPKSATAGMINELYLHEAEPTLISFPPYVVHAVQSVGDEDLLFVNMPTKPYNYKKPDKHRIPLESDKIDYNFNDRPLGY
jgi:dTDP-4-dehydrorhamnose 3,5-epimerase-like enzyme